MTATLQPVFESLGYKDAVQQQALVKLLLAAGAFGDQPNTGGVIDDRQAKAILENLTFTDAEQAARWLNTATQEHLLRPKGQEWYECVETENYQKHHDELAQALRQTGMLAQVQPSLKRYDHVLLLGAMESGVDTRLDTIKQLWDQGVRFDKIHLLGCERTLSPDLEPSSNTIGPKDQPVRTEMDMMEARYYEKSKAWSQDLQDVRVFEVDTFNHPDGKRADTKETVESWLHTHPASGNVLVISNQPYARYQDAAAKAALPANFHVETVGPAVDSSVKISVAVDALARQIHVGFPALLEKLQVHKDVFKTPLIGVNPAELKIDADTYQFRSGGDDYGVTKEKRFNTDQWDPILHGNPILVHERLDGSMYVADGHHRVDLAKRLNEQGKGPGNLLAMVLSEKQGYTAKDVKLIAAYKNIAEGQANVVDTARVLKEANAVDHPELLPHLQMDRGNLPVAATLATLSDTSLDTVANGAVPVELATRVAQKIDDPAQQDFAMRVLEERMKQKASPNPKISQPAANHADKIKSSNSNQTGAYLS